MENPILRPWARLSRLRPRAERYGLRPISAGSFGFHFLFRYFKRFSFSLVHWFGVFFVFHVLNNFEFEQIQNLNNFRNLHIFWI
jgi:hypothetical protein